jgi:hypothetical protein
MFKLTVVFPLLLCAILGAMLLIGLIETIKEVFRND